MKKPHRILLLLLAICLSLSAVSCGGNGDSEISGSDAQSDAGENVSQSEAPSARRLAVDAVLKECDKNQPFANILAGKKYDVSRAPDAAYPDTASTLTDGHAPIGFIPEIWVGYNSQTYEDLEVDFDLGAEYAGISDFSAYVMQYSPYGILAPESVTVSVADENGEFTEVGTAYTPLGIGNETIRLDVKLQGAVTARYIKFRFNKPTSTWLFVGELEAAAYGSEYASEEKLTDGREYYGFTGLPRSDGAEWPETESDRRKDGVIPPKNVYLYATESINAEYCNEWYNHKSPAMLYDTKRASSASMGDGAWMHFTRGGREIIWETENISAVSGIRAVFLQIGDAGIYFPVNFAVAVSLDGENWQTLYFEPIVGDAGDGIICRFECDFPSVKAKFVKISFDINAHVYMDELEIIGRKDTSEASDPDPEKSVGTQSLGYITSEDFDGVENILLSYHGHTSSDYGHDEGGLITAEEYLPYVAYLDEEGNIKDKFFDGFVFLPHGLFNRDGYVFTAKGWQEFVEDMYYPDRNMNALDECVAAVGASLSDPDYKVSVYTSVLRPWGDKPFGDIDGDGVNEDFSKAEDRKKAVKWLMDAEYNRFLEGNYEHLIFRGFYWHEEEIYYSDPLELEVVRYAVDYAHSLGMKMIWIPYNGSNGYNDWENLGFDLASYQPNYMFGQSYNNVFLYDIAEKAEVYGTCVEMEISDVNAFDDIRRFNEYLRVGAETGYMNGVKIYYQSGVPGAVSDACNSENKTLRKLYDDIYLFAKGEYTPAAEEDLTLPAYGGKSEIKRGRSLRMTLDLGETEEYAGYITLGASPKYGAVCVNRDGSLIYIAPKDFVGEDTFAVRIEMGNLSGELCYITVNVTE